MAATVYNGVLQGTGVTHTQVLYTNSTGKNVRIVWNFFEVGNTHPSELTVYYGASSAPNHGSGLNLDTMFISAPSAYTAGKHLSLLRNDSYTVNNAYSSYPGSFPVEMMLANTHKISIRIPAQISTNTNALAYNFVAITED
mgnify:CR=1 FL=1